MARSCLKFLSREEEDLVHQQSLKCLSDIGVLVHSKPVLEMLKQGGAEIDGKKMVAKLPESMVMAALKKTPKEFRLCARNPKNDVVLPTKDYPYISTNGLSVYMTDLETGKKRQTVRKDLAQFARLADSLDQIGFFWPQVTATDVPDQAHTIHELWVSLQNCTKHVQGDAVSSEDARMQIEIGALVAGGKKELKRRPIFSVTNCPIAPLSFERGAVEAQVAFARAGIPNSSMSMSLSGMSSPVTVAGTIVNANTENLASIVISQTAAPGAPHLYASESTPIDMNTGTINYTANECPMIASALAQMAKRYDMPCMVGQWGCDGDRPGMMASFNDLATIGMTMLTGTDCCSGMGGLESAKGASLEQMVIDAYLWENFRPILRNMTISEETIALDVVRQVGQGGTFLTHPHTSRNFKKELYFPDKKKMAWEQTLSDRMLKDAKKEVRRLLKEHDVPGIDKDIIREGDALLKSYDRTL